MSRALRVALMVLCLWQAATGLALAQEGRVAGQVRNGTTGQPAEGLTVTLQAFVGMAEQSPVTADTDADGRFAFAIVPSGDAAYWLTATYEGVRYASDLLRPEAGQTDFTADILVYETTADPAHVEIARSHLLMDVEASLVRVAELYIFSNTGDRTYVGDGQRTLQFLLPPGATNVQVDEQTGETDRFILAEGSVWDTVPLPPGASVAQHIIGYTLAYSPDAGLELQRTYPYPVARLNLLVPDVGVEATPQGLTYLGPMGGQQTFHNWGGEGLAPGAAWSVRLQGRPTVAAVPAGMGPAAAPDAFPAVGLLLAAGFVAGALPLFYLGLKRRRGGAPHLQTATADRLLGEIARLDDALARGEVDAATHGRLRAELKAALAGPPPQPPTGQA